MLNKLDAIKARFEQVGTALTNPEIINNQREFGAYSKEYRSLEKIVQPYEAYRKVLADFQFAKEALNGNDEEMRELAKMELPELEIKKEALEKELTKLLIPKDPQDDKNAILEIRAGTGGLEAGLFAADLFRMYSRFAQISGFKLETLSSSPNEAGGFKEIIANISGNGAYGKFKFESGTHRVQRVPATEQQGRIHTSAVTVAILPEAEEVEVDIKPEELKIDVFRSGGPGGQSVNTTDSAVRITHIPSGLVVSCQDEKSQLKNKQKGLKILRARLFEKITNERHAEMAKQRKEQVGSGDRSEKIRTYNYPDRRVTDHRVGFTSYNLEAVMEGKIGEFIDALYQAELEK